MRERTAHTPTWLPSRRAAAEFCAQLLPAAGDVIIVDFKETEAASPSAMDEVVRQLLQLGNAKRLVAINVSARVQNLLRRAAERRQTADRFEVAARS